MYVLFHQHVPQRIANSVILILDTKRYRGQLGIVARQQCDLALNGCRVKLVHVEDEK